MSGDLTLKKLEMSWECPNRESHRCSHRHCEEKRKAYHKSYHLANREKQNAKSRARYHNKYKHDPDLILKQKESWKKYAKKMGAEWVRQRSRKYGKPYASLSPSQRSKIRKAYTKWAKQNWEDRVQYAREYRRRKPGFGFRSKIADARRSGDIRKLAEECLDAIVRAYEASSTKGSDS